MPDASTFALFAATALVLLLTPGPAVLYIAARSVDQGRAAGLVSVLGIAVGTIGHVIAAAAGLSAILMRSATLFDTVRYAGAAYLIWLGIKTLASRNDAVDVEVKRESLWSIFRQGIMVNVLNPKTALFFFAFLPQFVQPSRGSATSQILILGFTFLLMGMTTDGCYALIAGSASSWLNARMRVTRTVSGVVYIGLGLVAALSGRRK